MNASAATSYSYTFTGLAQGANYLRLKEVAQDGQFIYSKLVSVSRSCGVAKEISVYPNPTRSTVTVQLYNASLLGASAKLVNMQGHVLRQFTINNVKKPVNMNGMAAGTYFIITGKQTFKIVKQ